MYNHHVLGKAFCNIFVLFHMSPLLEILIYTFKCAGKASSICITARDDNNEGVFRQTTLRSTFDKVSKTYVSQELSEELYILHEGTYIRVITISVPTVLQVAF